MSPPREPLQHCAGFRLISLRRPPIILLRPQPRPIRRGRLRLGLLALWLSAVCVPTDIADFTPLRLGVRGAAGAFVRNLIRADSLEQAGFAGDHRGLGSVGGAYFTVKGFDMQLDCRFGDVQIARDLFIWLALCESF